MKNIINLFLIFFFYTVSSQYGFCQEWIPYQNPSPVTIVEQTRVIYRPPQPVIIYQWVPYMVEQPYIIEKRCFFQRTSHIEYRPTIQWAYQPVVIYR